MAAHEGLHESLDKLKPFTLDLHRAIVSMMEELEAVDWYQQRVDASGDPALGNILAHNRDEELEHFAMTLEWVRRKLPKMDEALRTYLFTTGEITTLEESATGKAGGEGASTPERTTAPMTVGALHKR
ncbi:MAG: encapsulin-associated ferritin-like protein [Myxococcota bacterium]